MNIKELDERIKQLKDLVASANDTIKLAEEMVGLAEKEMDKLADQKKGEPKFERVGKTSCYSFIVFDIDGVNVAYDKDIGSIIDISRFETNNYFHTKERAEEVASKINFLLKLERLHDIYCPDYVPDWDDFSTFKYSVIYNPAEKRWYQTVAGVIETCTYFPTREIAQKVCDILNAELKEQERDCNE